MFASRSVVDQASPLCPSPGPTLSDSCISESPSVSQQSLEIIATPAEWRDTTDLLRAEYFHRPPGEAGRVFSVNVSPDVEAKPRLSSRLRGAAVRPDLGAKLPGELEGGPLLGRQVSEGPRPLASPSSTMGSIAARTAIEPVLLIGFERSAPAALAQGDCQGASGQPR
jgi:hypothetical protein